MTEKNRKPKICIIITVDISLDSLFPDFYPKLIAKGYEVVGICADGSRIENVRSQGVRVITVPMTRQFTPIQDLRCLWKVYKIFKHENFDLIHYSTPKASLLAAICGRLVGCPALLKTLRSLSYTSYGGLKRVIAKACEKFACRSAHYVIVISDFLRDQALKEGLLPIERMEVLGAGSSKGVNLNKFQLDDTIKANAIRIRNGLGINDDDIVVGYAGRLTEEKGIREFLMAFSNIRKSNGAVHMMLIGDQDKRCPLPQAVIDKIDRDNNIHSIGFTDDIVSYLAALDIFVLPTYREGFGNVLIEASALAKPVIGTNNTGCSNAMIDGKTGILVQMHDASSLEKALRQLIENPDKRSEMGKHGKQWVTENFDRKVVLNRLMDVYGQLLSSSKK